MLFRTESPFHTVWNDSIDLTITYQAVMHKLPTTKKTFNGTTKVKVYVNYTKVPIMVFLEIGPGARFNRDNRIGCEGR